MINYQWNQHQHQHHQTCANHHHHRDQYFLCKGYNRAYYLHQHRRQYILADFPGSSSCQFARGTWMAGASNQCKDVIWCQCRCIWKALCQQSFVLYVCFPTKFSWTHWWRKRSWCWWEWTKFGDWSCSSTSFVGLDFLPWFYLIFPCLESFIDIHFSCSHFTYGNVDDWTRRMVVRIQVVGFVATHTQNI